MRRYWKSKIFEILCDLCCCFSTAVITQSLHNHNTMHCHCNDEHCDHPDHDDLYDTGHDYVEDTDHHDVDDAGHNYVDDADHDDVDVAVHDNVDDAGHGQNGGLEVLWVELAGKLLEEKPTERSNIIWMAIVNHSENDFLKEICHRIMTRNQGGKSGCFAGSHLCGAKLQKSDGLQRPPHAPGEMVKMIFAMILNIVAIMILMQTQRHPHGPGERMFITMIINKLTN